MGGVLARQTRLTATFSRLGPGQLAICAVAVAVAYFVGVQIGIALTFRPATTSMLWPPNAILTAALLLVPPRHWWVCLGAALPVHLSLQLGAGMEPALSALLFVTNCSEALIAAGLVRALSDAPSEFNTIRRVAVFIAFAGLAAPMLSSFADAAVVHLLKGDDYWTVWRTRTFSNVLTELSVVPLLVHGVGALTGGSPAVGVGEPSSWAGSRRVSCAPRYGSSAIAGRLRFRACRRRRR